MTQEVRELREALYKMRDEARAREAEYREKAEGLGLGSAIKWTDRDFIAYYQGIDRGLMLALFKTEDMM